MLELDTQQMLHAFVHETLDALDSEESTVELLGAEHSRTATEAVFRLFHNIKGNSGFLGLPVVNALTHEAEALLDVFRRTNEVVDAPTISLLYETFDTLRILLKHIEQHWSDATSGNTAQQLIGKLKYAVNVRKGVVSAEDNDTSLGLNPSQILEQRFSAPDASFGDASLFAADEEDFFMDISADMKEKYFAEALDLITVAEETTLCYEKDPTNRALLDEIFGAVHSLKGNSGFMGFGEIEGMSMDLEHVLDAIRHDELDLYPGLFTVILSNVDVLRNQVLRASGVAEEALPTPQPAHNMRAVLEQIGQQTASMLTSAQVPPESLSAHAPETIPHEPQSLHRTEDVAQQPSPQHSITATPQNVDAKSVANDAINDVANDTIQGKTATPTPSAPTSSIAKKDIRVDTAKLDALFNLVGELITVETMVVNSPDLRGLELPGFTRAAGMLNKITRELQEVSMAIRMMPLEGLFNKMKRLVRDLSLRFGKKLALVIEGAETEMDKTVIEELSDPLMHILRNAIDHGIEPTVEERVGAGKAETATVRLAAQYEGNEILIIIEDDGRGLSREKILRKAQEQGLLKAHHATNIERVSDAEVWGYIFEAGFSTAEQVSDISGRGVGMDVVRKNIEKLQGRITVESQLGRGTRFVLRIPLTLAIMEGMTVRVGRGMYALPIVVIREAFRAKAEQITRTMDGVEMVKVREEMIAVVRLHEVYERVDGERDISKGIVVVVESDVGKVGLLVDEIVGQQQIVVKGLSEYIGSVRGVTGCMILSNGEIGLIIDVDAVVRLQEIH
jgi:two-component system chemotaxis sensor kinase CheA